MVEKEKRGFDLRRKMLLMVFTGISIIILVTVSMILILVNTAGSYDFFLNTISGKTHRLNQINLNLNVTQNNIRKFLIESELTQFDKVRNGISFMGTLIEEIHELDEEIALTLDNGDDGDIAEKVHEEFTELTNELKIAAELVFDLQMERGLNENSGLRGMLHRYTDELEKAVERSGSEELLKTFYRAKILELDYILTGKPSHAESFRIQTQLMKYYLADQPAILELLDRAEMSFAAYVEVSRAIEEALSRLTQANYSFDAAINNEISRMNSFLQVRKAELNESNRISVQNVLFLAIAVIVLEIMVAIALWLSISRPMKFIMKEASRLESGDLSADIDYGKRDEMGRISRSINVAVKAFRQLIGRAQTVSEQSVVLTSSIVATATETAASTTQINANINSINKKTGMLLEQVDNSSKATDDILEVINRFKESVHNQTASVEQATTAIEEMIATISSVDHIAQERGHAAEKLNKVTESGEAQINNTNRMIGEVAQIAEDIQNITKIINGIASQTNLLAMNAAIEAAHAGDVGRGFAVVADEIRKLAESSSLNAKQINQLLKEAGTRITSASEASSESISSFQDVKSEVEVFLRSLSEIAASMSEMSIGSQEILKSTAHLSQSMGEIYKETEEIVSDVHNISGSMGSVNRLTNETTNGISEIQLAIEEIDKSIVDLNEKCLENEELMEKMNGNLNEFRI